ncbi:MAG: WXG100 family type VII secretion target [Acidobacteriota bacterium]|jgi:WXG100 family type VII secretion target|nr:WXG100 family type VII secretion target [Acidobacteriota bacterium]
MANEITANPAELRRYADEIGKCYNVCRTSLYNSKSQVDSLKGVWTGAAAEAFAASFQKLLDKCAESLETMGHMGDALYESADAYERNEKAVQNEASKMPKLPNNTMR